MGDIKKRVTAIQGIPVSSTPPTVGQVLQFNGTEYIPTTLPIFFLPTDLGGLELWLRSDRGVTLSGSEVTAWADQSGTGDSNKNMTGAGGSANPTYNSSDSSYNHYPSVNFAGASSQYMNSTTWATTIAQPYTMFIVGNDDGTATTQVFVGGATNTQPWFFVDGSVYAIVAGYSGGSGVLDSTITNTVVPKVFRAEFNGSSSTVSVSTATSNVTGSVNAASVGAGTGGVYLGVDAEYESGHWLNGKIVEVIVYNSILSAMNVALVQNYLGSKYNITIGS